MGRYLIAGLIQGNGLVEKRMLSPEGAMENGKVHAVRLGTDSRCT
jgi:hypothetical protein